MKKHSDQRRRSAHAPPVLEQGIAINGELRVKLFGLNLLPIEVRLLISSKDIAAVVGLDWWNNGGAPAPARTGKHSLVARGRRDARRHLAPNGRSRQA